MGNAKIGRNRDASQGASFGDEIREEEEPAHHEVGESDPDVMLLASPEFGRALNVVCQAVFRKFGPSPRYAEWQDLRQETLIKFIPWLKANEDEATLKVTLTRIATNLCIDEERRRKALIRAHVETDLDEIDIEALRNPAAEDADVRVLFEECRSRFSGRKRLVFDEHFIEGRSLSEIAKRHGFSPQTGINILGQILSEVSPLILGQSASVEGGISNESSTRGSAAAWPQRRVVDELPATAAETAESKLAQRLLEDGLLSEVPPRITDFTPYRKRKPARVKGKSVSETIIEERR